MKKVSGFTLIELMVTLAVAVVLMAVGIPLFNSMQANSRAVALSGSLVTAINLARSEAISQGVAAAVCPKAASTPATTVCGTSSNWTNGWFVFRDLDQDGVRDNNEQVLKLWQAPPNGATISTNAAILRFTSRGALDVAATTLQLSQSNTKGDQTRCVRLSAVGQIRISKSTCS